MKMIIFRYITVFLVISSNYSQETGEYTNLLLATKNKEDVQTLVLWNENITDEIYEFSELEQLLLYECNIDSISHKVMKLNKLKIISIERSDLKAVSKELFNLESLEKVRLGDNRLLNLNFMGVNTSIKSLDLSYNKIEDLSNISKHLKGLVKFSCRSCGLSEVPDNIFTSKLEKLNLMENKIKNLPENIGNAIELKSLYLDKNEIESLPPTFFELSRLKHLHLANNKLKKINRKFQNFKLLQYVNLSFNEIEYIEHINFKSLKTLLIRGNKVSDIDCIKSYIKEFKTDLNSP